MPEPLPPPAGVDPARHHGGQHLRRHLRRARPARRHPPGPPPAREAGHRRLGSSPSRPAPRGATGGGGGHEARDSERRHCSPARPGGTDGPASTSPPRPRSEGGAVVGDGGGSGGRAETTRPAGRAGRVARAGARRGGRSRRGGRWTRPSTRRRRLRRGARVVSSLCRPRCTVSLRTAGRGLRVSGNGRCRRSHGAVARHRCTGTPAGGQLPPRQLQLAHHRGHVSTDAAVRSRTTTR